MASEKINETYTNHEHSHRHPLLRLGVFGFGCVGQGLYHVLEETQGVKAEIKKICVKTKNKQRPLAEDLFTFNKEDILNNPEIDVVVELIDDADAAFEIVKTALQNGKSVVTANKKMLAEHLEEIYQLQILYIIEDQLNLKSAKSVNNLLARMSCKLTLKFCLDLIVL